MIPLIDIKDFEIIKEIGHGSYGIVYLVNKIKDISNYAAKVTMLSNSNQGLLKYEMFNREITSYSKTDNPAILAILGQSQQDFLGNSNPTIILDYMKNGSVDKILRNETKISGSQRYLILLGTAIGMKYLHSKGLIHRDMKPENILLDDKLHPKICDFGCSFISDKKLSEIQMNEKLGTQQYNAPEIYLNEPYSYKVDVYAFSMIMYELLTGTEPFKNYSNNHKICVDVKNGIRPDVSMIKDKEIRQFIKKCWSGNPQERPAFIEIVEEIRQERYQKYFNANKEVIDSYLSIFDKDLINPYLLGDLDLKKEAENGNLDAISLLAKMLYYGVCGRQNKEEAKKYFQILAEKGNPESMFDYAFVLKEEIGNKESKIKAAEYYKKAADKGFINAMVNYAIMLKNGTGIPVDIKEAKKYFKMAADLGDIEAFSSYANLLQCEENSNENENVAVLLKTAADLGVVGSMNNYANYLIESKNIKEAAIYLKRAADNEHFEAMIKYGIILIRGYGIQKNLQEGKKYLEKAIDIGNSIEMKKIGFMKDSDIVFEPSDIIKCISNIAENENLDEYLISGRPKSTKNGVFYNFFYQYYDVNIKAEQDDSNALFVVGLMLWNGLGVKIDKKLAIKYFKIAANKGNTISMLKCGILYQRGCEVKKKENKALKYFKMAADQLSIEDKRLLSKVKYDDEKYIYYGIAEAQVLNGLIVFYSVELINNQEKNDHSYFEMATFYSKIYSAFYYSNMLYHGTGTPVNKKESFKYLTLTASLGHPDSMFQYGNMHISGEETEVNIEKGLDYLKRSADKECLEAMSRYGILLYEGKICPQNKEEGVKYIKKAADKNQFNAKLYYYVNIKKDQQAKINLIKNAAENDVDDAMKIYGDMLFEGKEIPMDKKKAAKYYEKLANKGDTESMRIYGILLIKGEGTYKKTKVGIDLIKKAIDLGNINALTSYGELLIKGEGIKKDIKEGYKYLKMAADKGDIYAMKYCVELNRSGEGINKNEKEAFKYCKLAADKGDIDSALLCFSFLFEGTGVQKNLKESLKYLKIAADGGNIEAEKLICTILFCENEFETNKELAAKYLKKAADKGDIDSIKKYANLKLHGNGVPVDKKEALHYFKIAADRGDVYSIKLLSKLFITGDWVPIDQEEGKRYLSMAATIFLQMKRK